MAKYKKKPVIIEAVQWDGSNVGEMKNFMGDKKNYRVIPTDYFPPEFDLIIHTLEGDMKASIGDYVIKGVSGEFYPCKPDIFEMTYEKIKDNGRL